MAIHRLPAHALAILLLAGAVCSAQVDSKKAVPPPPITVRLYTSEDQWEQGGRTNLIAEIVNNSDNPVSVWSEPFILLGGAPEPGSPAAARTEAATQPAAAPNDPEHNWGKFDHVIIRVEAPSGAEVEGPPHAGHNGAVDYRHINPHDKVYLAVSLNAGGLQPGKVRLSAEVSFSGLGTFASVVREVDLVPQPTNGTNLITVQP